MLAAEERRLRPNLDALALAELSSWAEDILRDAEPATFAGNGGDGEGTMMK